MGYIRFPVETDPETLVQEFYAYVQGFYPNWVPNDANLDVMIARFYAFKAGEIRDLVSDVQDDIFRFFGATMVGVQPIDAISAQGNTTWTMKDSAGYTIPAGTAVALNTSDGVSIPFITIADVTVPPGSSATAAGDVPIQALVPGTRGNNLTGNVTLIDTKEFIASVAIVGSTFGGIDAETDADYLSRLTRHLQRLSTRPILPEDFAIAAFDASVEIQRAVALDGYNPAHNFLTANQASAETDATGWAGKINATVASSSAQAADGAKSVAVSVTGAGTGIAKTPAVAPPGAGSIPCVPTDTITGICSFRAATVARSVSVSLEFFNAAGVSQGVLNGVASVDLITAWSQRTVTAVAPPTSAFVVLLVNIAGAGAAEVHYVDKAAIRRGTNTLWSVGGTAETGNTRMVAIAAANADGDPISSQAKTDEINFLQSQREIGFIVNTMDPIYTLIDSNTWIKVLPGFDPTTTANAVSAAVDAYFDDANWGVSPDDPHLWIESPTVYYNEVVTLVSNVTGVDRVTDLTINVGGLSPSPPQRTDLGIGNPAGLTQPGATVVTVV